MNATKTQNTSSLPVLGSTEYVSVASISRLPAKIDTGADSSAIWASALDVSKDGVLSFCLFDPSSEFYTGERLATRDYHAKIVRSSNGDEEIRYRVKLPLSLGGRTIRASFTLADRSKNNFPVLIGRRTIKGKFLVDVSSSEVAQAPKLRSVRLNHELAEDPYTFHKKYLK